MGKQKPVKYTFNPFELTGTKPPAGASKREILKEISEFVVESVLDKVGETNSPVSGRGKFKALSPKYKKIKDDIGPPIPNLELDGDMLDSLKAPIKGSTITLKVGFKENDKADGHCNFSGKSKIPTRRFIPKAKQGETFKKDIISGMRRLIKAFEE